MSDLKEQRGEALALLAQNKTAAGKAKALRMLREQQVGPVDFGGGPRLAPTQDYDPKMDSGGPGYDFRSDPRVLALQRLGTGFDVMQHGNENPVLSLPDMKFDLGPDVGIDLNQAITRFKQKRK